MAPVFTDPAGKVSIPAKQYSTAGSLSIAISIARARWRHWDGCGPARAVRRATRRGGRGRPPFWHRSARCAKRWRGEVRRSAPAISVPLGRRRSVCGLVFNGARWEFLMNTVQTRAALGFQTAPTMPAFLRRPLPFVLTLKSFRRQKPQEIRGVGLAGGLGFEPRLAESECTPSSFFDLKLQYLHAQLKPTNAGILK